MESSFDLRRVASWASTLAIAMLASSCLPDPLEVSGVPVAPTKIVVSSQLIPGQAVAVLLTRSIGALEASDDSDPTALLNQIIIEDASVTIRGNGNTYALSYLGSGLYGAANVQLNAGLSYTLDVTSPSTGSVTATTEVKPLISFDEATADFYYVGRDTLADISYQFTDPIGQNWYMVTGQRVTRRNLQSRLLNPRMTTKIFDDATFDGKVKQETFKVLFDEVSEGDTVMVTLSNVSQEYFRFMKLREDTRFGLVDFLGEPVNYPSNVQGGLGYFNLYTPDVRLFIMR